MLQLTPTILAEVVDKARADAAAHPRWLAAIGRALVELESNPWIDRNADGHGLLISSPSGKVYTANGVCGCTAYSHGQACWHRAAARLVRLHDEAIEREANSAPVRSLGQRLAAARAAADRLNEVFA